MKKAGFIYLLFFFFPFFAAAQFTIKGKVLDATTCEPLSEASVFCQNTTLGTTTNNDGMFSLQLPGGGYDLIFSYTGYFTKTVRATKNETLEILLVKQEKSMEEVILTNSFEVKDGWEKYGQFFTDLFIGSTPNAQQCHLVNPEVLKFYFYKRSQRLKIRATEPVLIANYALGYRLSYQLDSFVHYYKTNNSVYSGYCLFTEIDDCDSLKKIWKANRAMAYEGSKLQFMRSYYDSSVYEDGWVIDMLDKKGGKKFYRVTNPYDSLYYAGLDSTGQIAFWYPRKLSIAYTNKKPEPEYLEKMNLPEDVEYPISYIDVTDEISVMANGYYYPQQNWLSQGYWSWKNVGDQLPFDYWPDE